MSEKTNFEEISTTGISRRSFLSGSISVALLSGLSCSAISAFAKALKLDPNSLITLLKYDLAGFNGKNLDPITGNYMLGNGYRAYNPILMRFMSQDSLSPFSDGGINAYQYCSGDPVNRHDPSGHLDALKLGLGIFGIIVGIIGVIAAPFTGGTSLAITMGIIGSAAGAISGALSVAAAAVVDTNPDVAAKLDISSWAFTGISLLAGAAGAVGEVAQGVKTPGFVSSVTKGRVGAGRFKVEVKFRPQRIVKSKMEKLNKKMIDKVEIAEGLRGRPGLFIKQMDEIDSDFFTTAKKGNELLGEAAMKAPKTSFGKYSITTRSAKKGFYSWKSALTLGSAVAKQTGSIGSGAIGIVAKANRASANHQAEAIANAHGNQLADTPIAPGLSRIVVNNMDINTDPVNQAIRAGIFA